MWSVVQTTFQNFSQKKNQNNRKTWLRNRKEAETGNKKQRLTRTLCTMVLVQTKYSLFIKRSAFEKNSTFTSARVAKKSRKSVQCQIEFDG